MASAPQRQIIDVPLGNVRGPRGDPGPGPNQNLLDNWYFGPGVINQRKQMSVSGNGKMIVDRWQSYNSGSQTNDVTTDGIVNTCTSTSYPSGIRTIFQEELPEGEYTLSAIITNITEGHTVRIMALDSSGNFGTALGYVEANAAGLWTVTFTATAPIRRVAIRGNNRPSSFTVLAVKLERGDTQTLAHQKNGEWVLNELPNPAIELLKCQRYYQIFRNQAFRPTYGMDFRPVMLADEPVLDSTVISDITYYTASAEVAN